MPAVRDGVRIRRAEASDLEGMLDAYESVAAEGRYIGGELPIDRAERRARWPESLGDKSQGMFVAEAEGAIVGTAGVTGTGPSELGMLVVAGWRGRGVGSALLRASITWARQVGSHKVTLQVWPHNTAAINLYLKHGFSQEGYLRRHWRRRNGELWDAVSMGLPLDDGVTEAPRQ
ncbi:MAG: GNAT family N-acetyltransferase [Actinomycetota bacterium]|nr:GNAT family N-acetyltransferase [Actinomycetota bacterium]